MTRGVNDGDHVLGGLELPESNVDGDTTLTLSLQLVEHPSILEGTLAELGSFLLELLDGTLVDTSALVDQVTSGGGLARVLEEEGKAFWYQNHFSSCILGGGGNYSRRVQ